MFFIFLCPNKLEQAITLIGVTSTPQVFIHGWLKKRSQYKILEEKEDGVEVLYTKHEVTNEDKYQFMKRDKEKFYEQYSLLWSNVKNSPEIYQPLDKNVYIALL